MYKIMIVEDDFTIAESVSGHLQKWGFETKCIDDFMVTVHMPTFILSVVVTCIAFSFVYGIVYKITSKEYYGIVNE